MPAFAAPETCATVLKAALPLPTPRPVLPAQSDCPDNLPKGTLNEVEARALFETFGLTGAAGRMVQTEAEAEQAARDLGGPVVLKLVSRVIAHKSDVGGVRVGLTAATVGAAMEAMARGLAEQGLPAPEGYLVQTLVTGGIEMILGVRRDPQLGPLILLGAGGVEAELWDDSTLRLLPLAEGEAADMVAELRIARRLAGWRGAPAHDVSALIAAVEALAGMAGALGDRLDEAEINPLFVLSSGQGVAAADGLVVLAP